MSLVRWFREWRARGDAKAYDRWNQFLGVQTPNCEIVQFIGIRQEYANKGVKGEILRLTTGRTCAVWIPGYFAKLDSFLCVAGHDWGPDETHHGERVFHVEQLLDVVDQEVYRRML